MEDFVVLVLIDLSFTERFIDSKKEVIIEAYPFICKCRCEIYLKGFLALS